MEECNFPLFLTYR